MRSKKVNPKWVELPEVSVSNNEENAHCKVIRSESISLEFNLEIHNISDQDTSLLPSSTDIEHSETFYSCISRKEEDSAHDMML